jgi:hypothetical protein
MTNVSVIISGSHDGGFPMTMTNDEPQAEQSQPLTPSPKRPYRAPHLQLLGSVAELTLGSVGSNLDNRQMLKRGNG